MVETASARVPKIGELIAGKYRITQKIGEGGMGIVFRAFDEGLARTVAIKLIVPAHVDNRVVRERFVVEARAMAKVKHPNVVEIYDYDDYFGTPYFIMEFVEGSDLEQYMRTRDYKLSVDEVIGIMDQVCRGVQAMHEAGAVHHDLKPANVLVAPSFRVALTDLGLSRMISELRKRMGFLGGTAEYMAPEVAARADIDPNLAPRVDVYALGALTFQLLTGQFPYHHRDAKTVQRMQMEDPIPQPSKFDEELSPRFDKPIMRAMEKDPAKRTVSAAEFREQLMAARAGIRTIPAGVKTRILVVDDDEDFRDWAEAVLLDSIPTAEVACAENGKAALQRLADDGVPDAVVCDLQMPGMNGIELTAALRASPETESLPIIVVTAVGGAPDWQLLQRMGASAFLVKPVDAASLAARVRTVIDEAKNRREAQTSP